MRITRGWTNVHGVRSRAALITVLSVASACYGCGGDGDVAGAGGSGGTGASAGTSGNGGTAGAAGTGGNGGAAGATGTGGNGGTAGAGGRGGSGGMATGDPIGDLEPGHWLEVKNLDLDGNGSIDIIDSRLDAKDPCPTNTCIYTSLMGLRGITDACGAAFDSGRDRLIVWGGGRTQYGGNEIYVFDLDTLEWERLTDPSVDIAEPEGTADVPVYSDGLPRSRHTYNHLQYLPTVDRLIEPGSDHLYLASSPFVRTSVVSTYHFGGGVGPIGWQTGAVPDSPVPGAAASPIAMSSAVDPDTGHFWLIGTADGRLAEYDPDENTWTEHATTSAPPRLTSAIDPTRDIMVSVGVSHLLVHDLSDPNALGIDMASMSTGDDALEQTQAPGFVYDRVSDTFVGWDTGGDVFALDPDTWHWTRVSPAPGNIVVPSDPNSLGTYGRFRYSENKNVFVLVSAADENVFLYKLTNGG